MILSLINQNIPFPNTQLKDTYLHDDSLNRPIWVSLNNYLKENRLPDELERLLLGNPVQIKKKFEVDVLKEITTKQSIINKLFASGYLTTLNPEDAKSEQCSLVIPNKKLHTLIQNFMQQDTLTINTWITLHKQKKELEEIISRQKQGNYLFFISLCINSLVLINAINPYWLPLMLLSILNPSTSFFELSTKDRAIINRIKKDMIPDGFLEEEMRPSYFLEEVNSRIRRYSTYPVIQQYTQKKSRMAFLSGFHPHLGKNSMLNGHTFFKNPIYDKNVVKTIFEFCGDKPKKHSYSP
jgi:hypothetical protein